MISDVLDADRLQSFSFMLIWIDLVKIWNPELLSKFEKLDLHVYRLRVRISTICNLNTNSVLEKQ